MRQIGARLSSVVQALDDQAHSNFEAEVLGFPEAVQSLSDFVTGWSHGRSEISSGVKDAHESLYGAAGAYDTAESATERAFGESPK